MVKYIGIILAVKELFWEEDNGVFIERRTTGTARDGT
jgi:hypothetical protein